MKTSRLFQFTLTTSMALALLIGVSAAWGTPDGAAPKDRGDDKENSITGIWLGKFVTEKEVVSAGYLNITQHADGSLSGKWGNSPRSVLTIERGECVKNDVFQWEAASKANKNGRYRVRATLRGKTLFLDVTYTWRENGKIKGLTAASSLTKK